MKMKVWTCKSYDLSQQLSFVTFRCAIFFLCFSDILSRWTFMRPPTYLTCVENSGHFTNHPPTSSCPRGLWMTPYPNFISLNGKRMQALDLTVIVHLYYTCVIFIKYIHILIFFRWFIRYEGYNSRDCIPLCCRPGQFRTWGFTQISAHSANWKNTTARFFLRIQARYVSRLSTYAAAESQGSKFKTNQ